jgi:DNA-3-methyladenine glycosylase
MLNITTGSEGHPEAVLIRGVEGISGPGRVTKALFITREDNTKPLAVESGLWIEDDGYTARFRADKRVGIDYAAPCDRDREWRYILCE